MSYLCSTMPNGLRVASETFAQSESVSLVLSVGTGARYESLQEGGISHLLEHMAFKGTAVRTAADIAEAFDNIGGQFNAYTSLEMTVYYAKVLKKDVALAADILGDILLNSRFDEAEIAREKNVIIQEIGMHHDSPEDLIVDYYDETAFPNQPLGRSILSTPERVASHSRDAILHYMQKHYTPARMVLSAAGAITHEMLLMLAERYFAITPSSHAAEPEPAYYRGGSRLEDRDFEQLHLMLGLPALSIHDSRYYVLQIYANILGGGMASRLFQDVREKRGLAYTVYASGSGYADTGMLSLYAACAPDKAAELSQVLVAHIAQMAERIEDKELLRAKNQQKAELLMARENAQAVAKWIGRHLLMYGEYRQVPDLTARIDAVAKDDIITLAHDLTRGKLTLAALGDVSAMPDYRELQTRLASGSEFGA